MIHEQRPWEAEDYERMLHEYVEIEYPRWFRILSVVLQRSWLRRLWRRLRRYFAGPT